MDFVVKIQDGRMNFRPTTMAVSSDEVPPDISLTVNRNSRVAGITADMVGGKTAENIRLGIVVQEKEEAVHIT